MPRPPLDVYVAGVAAALTMEGVAVTGTWTEAVEPTDHVIAIAVQPRGTMHLVWEDTDRGWRFFIYSSARVAAGLPDAGPLPGCGGRPEVVTVVRAVRVLLGKLAGA